MVLAHATWKEVDSFTRDAVVVIPTGSLEQHGPHLPLFTDTILASAAAEAVEQRMPGAVLLTPALWLGASSHHLRFPGSLSASFEGYEAAIAAIVRSLWPHGFRKFYVVNGHGGNSEPNGIAMRRLRDEFPDGVFGHSGYFAFIPQAVLDSMKGPAKGIRHACEAETSMMLHIRPDFVRSKLVRDDGLRTEPEVRGIVSRFDELTEEGSYGFATFADVDLGRRLFESAVDGLQKELNAVFEGFVYVGDQV